MKICDVIVLFYFYFIFDLRFYIIYNPFAIRKVSAKKTSIAILVCFILSLFWAICPLFGWSHYSLEGGLTSCSVEWAERSWNVQSYNIVMFIFAYIVPLFIIIYCNTHMLIIVRIMRNIFKTYNNFLLINRLKKFQTVKLIRN